MSAVVVIPTYNERDNIKELIDRILRVSSDIHILVVDDDSPDGTAAVVDSIVTTTSRVHIIRRKTDRGRGRAGIVGFQYAIDNNILVIDLLPILREKMKEQGVDPKESFLDFWGHLSPMGSKITAEVLADFIQSKRWIDNLLMNHKRNKTIITY